MPFPIFFTDNRVGIGQPNPAVDLDVVGSVAISGGLTVAGASIAGLTVGAVGSTPNANAASIASNVLTLQPADGTHPGVVTSGAQTIGGAKTFSSTVAASNLSGTNTGDITLAAVGAVPNANGASLTAQALTLQAADGSNPGVITAGTQTIGGVKTFSTPPVSSTGFLLVAGAGGGVGGDATEVFLRAPNAGGEVHFQNLFATEYGKCNSLGFQTNHTYSAPYTDSSGTPGNATINKASGRSAVAGSSATITITNSVCTATSVVLICPEDLDITLLTWKVAPAAGSFVLTGVAAATATWKFRWFLFNTQ